MYAEYLALIHTLNNLNDGDATSLRYYHISQPLTRLFKRELWIFPKLHQQLNTPKGSLMTQWKQSPINRLKVDLQDDGSLGLLDLNASEHQYQGLENLLCNYVDALKTNIDKRL